MSVAANEYSYNVGQDFSMLDALDPEFLDTKAAEENPRRNRFAGEDVEHMTDTERWAVNAALAEWYGI